MPTRLSDHLTTTFTGPQGPQGATGPQGPQGPSSMSDGTAAAPGLPFADNTATGFYRPAANTLGFVTASSERVRIDSTGRMNVASMTISANVDSSGTGYLQVPSGTTAQRPGSPLNGMIRYNSTLNITEIYQSGVWESVALNYSVSNATAITVNTGTPTTIASCSITTIGKAVLLVGAGDGNPNQSGGWHRLRFYRNESEIGKQIINENAGGHSKNCPFALCFIDTPSAGTYTYSIRAWHGSGSFTYGEEGDHQASTIWAVEVL